jgi:hypothetical protein
MLEKLNTSEPDLADIRELKTEEFENVSGGAESGTGCTVTVTWIGSSPRISVQCR